MGKFDSCRRVLAAYGVQVTTQLRDFTISSCDFYVGFLFFSEQKKT